MPDERHQKPLKAWWFSDLILSGADNYAERWELLRVVGT